MNTYTYNFAEGQQVEFAEPHGAYTFEGFRFVADYDKISVRVLWRATMFVNAHGQITRISEDSGCTTVHELEFFTCYGSDRGTMTAFMMQLEAERYSRISIERHALEVFAPMVERSWDLFTWIAAHCDIL